MHKFGARPLEGGGVQLNGIENQSLIVSSINDLQGLIPLLPPLFLSLVDHEYKSYSFLLF